jgi:Flp pilus assembly protein TadB
MSKERARRREAREREAAIVTAARAAEAEKRERRVARKRALTSRTPRRRSRPTGVLAARRRKRLGVTVAIVLALNVLVWVIFPGWPMRAMVLVVSLLVTPVLLAMTSRR